MKYLPNLGFESLEVDTERGFILNGSEYPLRGVSRHQDYRGMGSAITNKEHEEDITFIMEVGATAVCLAHYQNARSFMIGVMKKSSLSGAETPYISEHLKHGNDNIESQIRELIIQNFNRPSIIWGISNEITIFIKNKKTMMGNLPRLKTCVINWILQDLLRLYAILCVHRSIRWYIRCPISSDKIYILVGMCLDSGLMICGSHFFVLPKTQDCFERVPSTGLK